MDIDVIAKAIFDELNERGCFDGIDDEIRAEILQKIGDIIEEMG
jgi:hypothetical protein